MVRSSQSLLLLLRSLVQLKVVASGDGLGVVERAQKTVVVGTGSGDGLGVVELAGRNTGVCSRCGAGGVGG